MYKKIRLSLCPTFRVKRHRFISAIQLKKYHYRDTEKHGSIEKGKKNNCLKDAGKTSQREIKFEQAERGKGHFCQREKKGFDLRNLSKHSGKF